MGTDHAIELVLLPIIVPIGPHAVKPDTANGAVTRAKQLHALLEIMHVSVPIALPVPLGIPFGVEGTGGLPPIDEGVVEEGQQLCFPTGIHKFLHQIPAADMGRIKVTEALGIVQGKTVMVPGGEGDIFTAGIFGCQSQLLGPKGIGAESFRQLVIFLLGNAQTLLCPLALAQLAVKTEVDKHTEAQLFKIQNPLFYDHRKAFFLM